MSNVVTMRPDAPLTPEQQIAAIVDDYLRDMAAIGIDLNEPDEDADENEE